MSVLAVGKVNIIDSKGVYDAAMNMSQERLVVLDFYADWCGPCKNIAPEFEKLASAHDDVLFCKVNVDDQEELTEANEVQAMPTFVFIKKKDRVHTLRGANIETLTNTITTHK